MVRAFAENNNCDGSGPHYAGQVRVLPLSTNPVHGNAILCEKCFRNEMLWRYSRNRELATDAQFDLPEWESLEIYGGSE